MCESLNLSDGIDSYRFEGISILAGIYVKLFD